MEDEDWRLKALKQEYKAHRDLASVFFKLADDPPFPRSSEEFEEPAEYHLRIADTRLKSIRRILS